MLKIKWRLYHMMEALNWNGPTLKLVEGALIKKGPRHIMKVNANFRGRRYHHEAHATMKGPTPK